SGEPPSAPLEIQVVADAKLAAADGDPVGRLLPLVKDGWWLGTGAPQPDLQPGRNWGKGRGRIVRFVFNPPATKNESGLINLCLMDEASDALPPDANSSLPASEYLGKASRWHVYFLISPNARNAWPSAKEDIRRALTAEGGSDARSNDDQPGRAAAKTLTITIVADDE